MPPVSSTLTWCFVALALVLAVAFVRALAWSDLRAGTPQNARRIHIPAAVLLTLAWMTLTYGLAASGRLTFDGRPPTMLLLFVVSLLLAIALGLSPIGARLAATLPLSLLVGFQSFRILVELLIARAHREGPAPIELTYHGRNFDIITGLTAAIIAALLVSGALSPRLRLSVVAAWNVLGSALLLNVYSIAVLSSPTAYRIFYSTPSNAWVAHAPWVWLPSVMVVAGALGHVLVFRRLRAIARELAAHRSVRIV